MITALTETFPQTLPQAQPLSHTDEVAERVKATASDLNDAIDRTLRAYKALGDALEALHTARKAAGVPLHAILTEAATLTFGRVKSKDSFYRYIALAKGWEKLMAVPEDERREWGLVKAVKFVRADTNKHHGNSKAARELKDWMLRDKGDGSTNESPTQALAKQAPPAPGHGEGETGTGEPGQGGDGGGDSVETILRLAAQYNVTVSGAQADLANWLRDVTGLLTGKK